MQRSKSWKVVLFQTLKVLNSCFIPNLKVDNSYRYNVIVGVYLNPSVLAAKLTQLKVNKVKKGWIWTKQCCMLWIYWSCFIFVNLWNSFQCHYEWHQFWFQTLHSTVKCGPSCVQAFHFDVFFAVLSIPNPVDQAS